MAAADTAEAVDKGGIRAFSLQNNALWRKTSAFGDRLIVLFFQLFLVMVEFLDLGLGSLLRGSKRGNLGVLGADFSLDGCDLAAEEKHHALTTHN